MAGVELPCNRFPLGSEAERGLFLLAEDTRLLSRLGDRDRSSRISRRELLGVCSWSRPPRSPLKLIAERESATSTEELIDRPVSGRSFSSVRERLALLTDVGRASLLAVATSKTEAALEDGSPFRSAVSQLCRTSSWCLSITGAFEKEAASFGGLSITVCAGLVLFSWASSAEDCFVAVDGSVPLCAPSDKTGPNGFSAAEAAGAVPGPGNLNGTETLIRRVDWKRCSEKRLKSQNILRNLVL